MHNPLLTPYLNYEVFRSQLVTADNLMPLVLGLRDFS